MTCNSQVGARCPRTTACVGYALPSPLGLGGRRGAFFAPLHESLAVGADVSCNPPPRVTPRCARQVVCLIHQVARALARPGPQLRLQGALVPVLKPPGNACNRQPPAFHAAPRRAPPAGLGHAVPTMSWQDPRAEQMKGYLCRTTKLKEDAWIKLCSDEQNK